MAGEHIDLSSDGDRRQSEPKEGRRFVGVHFACCSVYARVYINRWQTSYDGRCPRCLRAVKFKIGPGGTSARFFTAS